MAFGGWPAEALAFYAGLEDDNSKEYWTSRKAVYQEKVLRPMEELLEELAPELGELLCQHSVSAPKIENSLARLWGKKLQNRRTQVRNEPRVLRIGIGVPHLSCTHSKMISPLLGSNGESGGIYPSAAGSRARTSLILPI